MADSTPDRQHRSPSRWAWQALLATVIMGVLACWGSPAAFADGDPASDVLAQQSLFLPQDAGVSARQQTQLAALLQAATRSGYQLRVALIASPADLGSVTALWGQPQNYAEFLGQELSLVYHGPLLVVMPRGLGLYHQNHPDAPERTAIATLPPGSPDLGLGTIALQAIQHLAAAAGHPLPTPIPAAAPTRTASDPTPWIVFALGCLLIALAWAASFRAKPPRSRRRATAAT